MRKKPAVLVVIGSSSDEEVIEPCLAELKRLGIPYLKEVSSAHRSPARTRRLAEQARRAGIKVIIAAAGHAAHLPGFIASHTDLPVVGVPIPSSPLLGFDSLLSMVQMPKGVPVAVMALGKSGAANAALFAARLLSVVGA